MELSSSDGFGPEVDDVLYIDEDLELPVEMAIEYGYSSITIFKNEYDVVLIGDVSVCTVSVNLIN